MLASASHSKRRWCAAAFILGFSSISAEAASPAFLPEIAPSSEFPDARHATRREGLFLPPEMPRLLTPGMTKRQAYALLGAPHFHEGLFGERRWDYILNFYTGSGTEYRICRLQLRWDHRMRLEWIGWSDKECQALVLPGPQRDEPATPPAPATPKVEEQPAVTVYFDFDKAVVNEKGRQDLAAFVAAHPLQGQSLSIIGHTDSAGPDAYNDRLSLMRADAVARSLATMGVPIAKLEASGAGERSSRLTTENGAADPLRRRVVVTMGSGRF